jgi:hypothetical protein
VGPGSSPVMSFIDPAPSAGTHSYTLQALAGASGIILVEYVSMVAWEL